MWAKEVKGAIVDREMVRSLIIAFIVGGVVLYGSVQTLGARIDNIEVIEKVRHAHLDNDIKDIKRKIEEIHKHLFAPTYTGR
jgi:hypothetical protein